MAMLLKAGLKAGRFAARRGVRSLADDAAAAAQVNLNFTMPHGEIFVNTPVDMVIVPGVAGEYGVTAGHSPVISELKPGLVQVFHKKTDEPEKYFVSAGFSFTHADSTTDISAVEAVKLDDIDLEAAKKGLVDYKSAMDAAADGSIERAQAEVQYNVANAMCVALGAGNA